MTPSLLPAELASRFYLHWLNADRETRIKQVLSLAKASVSKTHLAELLEKETAAGFPLPRAMRRIRNLLIATLIERDLTGKADLSEIVSTMSSFAEFAIQTHTEALTTELTSLHGTPTGDQSGKQQQLIVLGMGKLGGHELNVSSDVDLIFIYPEDGETKTSLPGQRQLSNHEFFNRLGKRLIGALSEISEDGFTFRVDMALRPNGASGPLVATFNNLEQYLIVQGREWERYAWIKSLAITGDKEDIAALEKIVQPFIYRRYLDYGVIDAIRDMHQQIRSEVIRQERLHPERTNNVKLGRGGIREIEFLAQMFQLIRGGRDAALRERSTRKILHILVEKRQLEADISSQLLDSYNFLRNLEHRLQYLDDAQTHSLPSNETDLITVAKMMGVPTGEDLLADLQQHRDFVAAQFDAIFSDKKSASDGSPPTLQQPLLTNLPEEEQLLAIEAKLNVLGFIEARQAAQRLLSLWKTNRVHSLSDLNRTRLIALINIVLPMIAKNSTTPLITLGRLLDFFESILRRTAYLSLLTEYPSALERLIRMMDTSEWASAYLVRHPILLDELLDVRTLMATPDWDSLAKELQVQLFEQRGDTERQMDLLRETHHAQLFRLLAQDLEGVLTVERQADHLSKLADVIVGAAIHEIWQNIATRHRESPQFTAVAYGKLGGKELGYASDLDLIFLYEDDHPDAPMLYARLAQRFITWMTTPTSAGILFDIDIALRPDGASGLMVSSLASFERYQNESAWAWEHQALTRARFCAGNERIGEQFEKIRENILCKKRDANWLRQEILGTRKKIHDAHPNRSTRFDLKHDTGGMIDIEFIVQYLVLMHASIYPELTGNIGNIALLILCEKLGLIPAPLGETVASNYREFRRQQHHIRMQGAAQARMDTALVSERIAQVRQLWDWVFAEKT